MVGLGDGDVLHADKEHRLVMIDLNNDVVVVLTNYREYLLFMTDLGVDDAAVHVDCGSHRLVTIDLADNYVFHMDY